MELTDVLRAERAAAVSLWAETFGDPPALVGRFLDLLPELGFGLAACEDGTLLGTAYWIDALRLDEARCGCLYAVAVRPEARSRGLGAALCRACLARGKERGALYCCTEPAEPSLFTWYAGLGLRPALRRSCRELPAKAGLPLRPLSAQHYGERREALLAGRPHVTLLDAALRFEEALLRAYGGGFFAAGDGIIAVEKENGAAVLREALGSDAETLAASAAAALGCERALLYETGDAGEDFLAAQTPFPPGTSWNLSFD